MSLWLPCGLHGFAVPNTVTVTVSIAAVCAVQQQCASGTYRSVHVHSVNNKCTNSCVDIVGVWDAGCGVSPSIPLYWGSGGFNSA
jgi:hypothetical protein